MTFVVPDLRGSGASDRPTTGYTIERIARDVLAVMGHVSSDRPVVLVGHSAGSQIVQWVAAHEPTRVAGMVLLTPVPADGLALPPDAQQLFRNCAGQRSMQSTILDLACKQLSDAGRAKILDDAASIQAPSIQEWFDAWTKGGFADKLSAVRAPTLAVTTDDPFFPPEFVRSSTTSKIAGARLAVLPGPGHYLTVENPRGTTALLESFFAGLH